jgi:hypothetical protein
MEKTNSNDNFHFQRVESLLLEGERALLIYDEKSSWKNALLRKFDVVDEVPLRELHSGHICFSIKDNYDLVLIDKCNSAVQFMSYFFKILKRSSRCYFSFYSDIRDKSEPSIHEQPGLNRDKIRKLILKKGFCFYQEGADGQIIGEWLNDFEQPKFTCFIWESIFYKPERMSAIIKTFFQKYHFFIKYMELFFQRVPCTADKLLIKAANEKNRLYFWQPVNNPVLTNYTRAIYPLMRINSIERTIASIGETTYFENILRTLIIDKRSDLDKIRAILLFVQSAFYRNPVTQPLTELHTLPSPAASLASGIGRCGVTNQVLVTLLKMAGYDANVWQLKNHISATVKLDGHDVLIDADMFKHGVLPLKDNQFISKASIISDPYILDHLPQTGWVYGSDVNEVTRTFFGHARGYVDARPLHLLGFPSFYYGAEVRGYCPSVPSNVRISKTSKEALVLEWNESLNANKDEEIGYEIFIASKSIGFDVDNINPMINDSYEFKKIFFTYDLSLEISQNEFDFGVNFIVVKPRTDWTLKNKNTFYWPSKEITYFKEHIL